MAMMVMYRLETLTSLLGGRKNAKLGSGGDAEPNGFTIVGTGPTFQQRAVRRYGKRRTILGGGGDGEPRGLVINRR